jgi:hypothetical protein
VERGVTAPRNVLTSATLSRMDSKEEVAEEVVIVMRRMRSGLTPL